MGSRCGLLNRPNKPCADAWPAKPTMKTMAKAVANGLAYRIRLAENVQFLCMITPINRPLVAARGKMVHSSGRVHLASYLQSAPDRNRCSCCSILLARSLSVLAAQREYAPLR